VRTPTIKHAIKHTTKDTIKNCMFYCMFYCSCANSIKLRRIVTFYLSAPGIGTLTIR